jgi:phosphatidate cytidylyltransferase
MSNFWQRTLTGIVFVIAVIGSLLYDYIMFAGVFAVFTAVGMWEFYAMTAKKNIFPLVLPGIIAGLLVFFITVIDNAHLIIGFHPEKYYAFVFLCILVFFIAELYRKSEKAVENISVCIAGIIYVAVPFSILISIPVIDFDEKNSTGQIALIAFFTFMWMYDIFAYLTGIWLGKHRLFERISPKKSWEGLVGGTLITLSLAVILPYYFVVGFSPFQWLIMSLLIIVFGTFGDLVESMLKRQAGVKDSGAFFPGHGGVLDRFDAVLFAAPVVYFYLKFFI